MGSWLDASSNNENTTLFINETFTNRKDAKAREVFLKSGTSNVPAAFDAAALDVHS